MTNSLEKSVSEQERLHADGTSDEDLYVEDRERSETWDEDEPIAGWPVNALCGLVVILLGIIGIVGALQLQLGTLVTPTAGTWPAIVSGLLLLVGTFIVAMSRRFMDAEAMDRSVLRVAVGVVSLVATAFLIPLIGFEIPSFLLLMFWMIVIGRERIIISSVVSSTTVALFYIIFVFGLNVPLPRLF